MQLGHTWHQKHLWFFYARYSSLWDASLIYLSDIFETEETTDFTDGCRRSRPYPCYPCHPWLSCDR